MFDPLKESTVGKITDFFRKIVIKKQAQRELPTDNRIKVKFLKRFTVRNQHCFFMFFERFADGEMYARLESAVPKVRFAITKHIERSYFEKDKYFMHNFKDEVIIREIERERERDREISLSSQCLSTAKKLLLPGAFIPSS